jgi:hypothetical protein
LSSVEAKDGSTSGLAWRVLLAPFFVISRSCLPALLCLPAREDSVVLGVKNRVNLFGVIVGGFFSFWLLREAISLATSAGGDERKFSWSCKIWCCSYSLF